MSGKGFTSNSVTYFSFFISCNEDIYHFSIVARTTESLTEQGQGLSQKESFIL